MNNPSEYGISCKHFWKVFIMSFFSTWKNIDIQNTELHSKLLGSFGAFLPCANWNIVYSNLHMAKMPTWRDLSLM